MRRNWSGARTPASWLKNNIDHSSLYPCCSCQWVRNLPMARAHQLAGRLDRIKRRAAYMRATRRDAIRDLIECSVLELRSEPVVGRKRIGEVVLQLILCEL